MINFKRYLFVILISSFSFFAQAQDSISVEMKNGKTFYVKMPEEKHSFLKDTAPLLPLLGVMAALFGIWYQIRTRRTDEISKNQLERLNNQITEFYGPLYSLYETGHQNFYAYLELYGDQFHFGNPNYKPWDLTIFQPTNLKMEEIIITKADLIIGNKMPNFFLQFCQWLTAQKAYFYAESQPDFNNNVWLPIIERYKHPEIKMQMYLRASFEKLKKVQSDILTGKMKFVKEEKLLKDINRLAEVYKTDSRRPDTWENKIWARVPEINEKFKKEMIRRMEEALIKKSRIPDAWKGNDEVKTDHEKG